MKMHNLNKFWIHYDAKFMVTFSSRFCSLALKSSWKSHQMTPFFRSKRGIGWKDHLLSEIWQCFHLKKLTTWERENESKRKKEPQIPCLKIQIPLQKIVQSIAQCEVNSSSKESTILLCAYSWGPHVELLENEQNLYCTVHIDMLSFENVMSDLFSLEKSFNDLFFKEAKIGFWLILKVNMCVF